MTDFAADDGAGLISASPDTSVLAAVSFFFNYRIGNATEVVFFEQILALLDIVRVQSNSRVPRTVVRRSLGGIRGGVLG